MLSTLLSRIGNSEPVMENVLFCGGLGVPPREYSETIPDDMYARGNAAWAVWKRDPNGKPQWSKATRRPALGSGTHSRARLPPQGRQSDCASPPPSGCTAQLTAGKAQSAQRQIPGFLPSDPDSTDSTDWEKTFGCSRIRSFDGSLGSMTQETLRTQETTEGCQLLAATCVLTATG